MVRSRSGSHRAIQFCHPEAAKTQRDPNCAWWITRDKLSALVLELRSLAPATAGLARDDEHHKRLRP
jgi:hypothetical protein